MGRTITDPLGNEIPVDVALDRLEIGEFVYTVSTINRKCSAVGSYSMIYAETIVFKAPIGDDNVSSRHIAWQGEAFTGSRSTHDMVVGKLRDVGPSWLDGGDDDDDDDE